MVPPFFFDGFSTADSSLFSPSMINEKVVYESIGKLLAQDRDYLHIPSRMHDPIPEFEQLFTRDGGFEKVFKKLLRLATTELAAARISAGNVGELARLSEEEIVFIALERLQDEGVKDKGAYYTLRNHIRNYIRTLEKSPRVQFEATAGNDSNQWSEYWEGVEDTASWDPALAAERRETEDISTAILERLKYIFSGKEDELAIIDAFQNQFYKRKEVLASLLECLPRISIELLKGFNVKHLA